MKFSTSKNQRGFTLIEILVVITIVGLLSSIVMSTLLIARKKGRDGKRIADIRQINSAIQLYIDNNGHAPYVGPYDCQASNVGGCGTIAETNADQWSQLETELKPYISKLPTDPCGVTCWDQPNSKWFAYEYYPPSAIAYHCEAISCPLEQATMNQQYSILAETMEVSSPLYVLHAAWRAPSFGIIGHTMGGTSF